MPVRPARSFLRRSQAGLLIALVLGVACCGGTQSTGASEQRRTAVVKAIELARPSIVNIHGQKTIMETDEGTGRVDVPKRVDGMGTGVVIDERGYIITNHHVIEGVPKIQVTLYDGQSVTGRVVAADPKNDLAVIKINPPEKLPPIVIGTSSDLMIGETVIAIGNAYGYEHTVTDGIISALHRTVQVSDSQSYQDLIQTDASINPGNSGGPLLNIDGEMIGLNVAVRAGAQGIGFAIPVNKTMSVAAGLLNIQRLDNTWHGVVAAANASPDQPGIMVAATDQDSPASNCGLKTGDVIMSVGRLSVARPLDLERALLGHKPGDEVPITLQRNHQNVNVNLVLAAAAPAPKVAADPVWQMLGLRLAPMPTDQFRKLQSKYRGGLTITAVRRDSPAAKQGVRPGDVLVGMRDWETTSLDNVAWILERPDSADVDLIKFFIIRGNETLYGHLPVSLQKN